jgi:hypothetical protein
MAFDAQEDRGVNPSLNPTFSEIVAIRLSRREVLIGGLGAAVMAGLGLAGDGGAEPPLVASSTRARPSR